MFARGRQTTYNNLRGRGGLENWW